MLGSALVTLREGFEAALVVGIVLAYVHKTGNGARTGAVWAGVAAAVLASLAAGAVLFVSVGELSGTAEQLYEGLAMLLAVLILTWMIFWMRRQSLSLGADLRARVDMALRAGGTLALAGVAFVAVAREGIETSLFLFAITKDSTPLATGIGSALGLAVAVALGAAIYRGSARLDLRRFFSLTSVFLFVFAGYLLVRALEELAEAGAGGEALEEARFFLVGLYLVATVALWLRPPAWLAGRRRAQVGRQGAIS